MASMSNVREQLKQQIGVYQACIGKIEGMIETLDSLPSVDEQLIASQPSSAQSQRTENVVGTAASKAAGNAAGKSADKPARKTATKTASKTSGKTAGSAAKTTAKESTQVAATGDGSELPKRKRGRPSNAEKAARLAAEQANAAGQGGAQADAAGKTESSAQGAAAGTGTTARKQSAKQKKAAAQQGGDTQSAGAVPKKRGPKPKTAETQQTGAAANGKQQGATNNAAGSRGDMLPDTGEDFWLGLVGKEPQNHDQIFRAAIERIAGANPSAMTPAMEQKLQARMENNLREMTKSGVLKSEGRGEDKTFVRQ